MSSQKTLACSSCTIPPKKCKTKTSHFLIETTRLFTFLVREFEQLFGSIGWQVMVEHLLAQNWLVLYLTLWEPLYDIFVVQFRPKNISFQLPYQRPSSSADCARELFNGSNGSASLVDCTRKKNFLPEGCGFSVSDVISGGLLGHLNPLFLALGANR